MNTTDINSKVAEAISTAAPKVITTVVSQLADVEINKRVAALSTVIGQVTTLKRDLNKIDRPDVLTFGRDGKPTGEGTYTKPRVEELNKLVAKIAKYEKAIDKATSETPDFSEVYNLANSKGGNTEEKTEDATG